MFLTRFCQKACWTILHDHDALRGVFECNSMIHQFRDELPLSLVLVSVDSTWWRCECFCGRLLKSFFCYSNEYNNCSPYLRTSTQGYLLKMTLDTWESPTKMCTNAPYKTKIGSMLSFKFKCSKAAIPHRLLIH